MCLVAILDATCMLLGSPWGLRQPNGDEIIGKTLELTALS